jgi:response regulator RpfG family c-di-GMP phosphodiesterase
MVYYNIAFLISLVLSMMYVMRYQKHYDVCITAIFLLIPITNLGFIIRASSETLSQAMLANSIIYMGGCFLPFFLTFSILSLCEYKVRPFLRTAILFVNSLLFFFILTTDSNHLFYQTVRFNKHNGIGVLTKTYGPLHTVYYVLIILYMAAAFITIIYSFFKRQHVSRIMLILLVLPELFTMLGFFGGKIHGLTLEVTPYAFIFAQIVYLFISSRMTLYKTSDMAVETLLENGENAFILIDKKYRYLGSNNTAKRILKELEELPIDRRLNKNESLNKTLIHWVKCFEEDPKNGDNMYIQKNPVNPDDYHVYNIRVDNLIVGKKDVGYQVFLFDDTEDVKYIKLLNNYNFELEGEVEKKTQRIVEMHNNLILSMATMVESRDNSTGGHIKRTSDCVKILIEEMKKDSRFKLTDEFCKNLIKAAPMHDLGKIAVDDAILRKPGRFTDAEFEEMKKHAKEGARIVHEILKGTDDHAFHILAENVAHYHHERFDGSGYPEGLKGEAIPFEARIMAIADVYDALVSKRVYKERMSFEDANRIIMDGMGTHFDPQLKEIYVAARPRLEAYYKAQDE